jgi:hypothetical protein
MYSTDEGSTWTKPLPVEFSGLPAGARRPFDPTLVLLEDGRLRLYFTCTTPDRPMPGIYSAVSSDGKTFEFEPGLRFGVDGEMTIDCAVARLGRTWHLYSPVQDHDSLGYHATSADGLTFERVADIHLPIRGHWLGSAVARGEELYFFGSGGAGGFVAQSRDGAEWRVYSSRLQVGADPGAVQLKGGTWLVIATGGLRADAPAELPWRTGNSTPAAGRARTQP